MKWCPSTIRAIQMMSLTVPIILWCHTLCLTILTPPQIILALMTSTSSDSNCCMVETSSCLIACSILSHSSYSDIIDHVNCYSVQSIHTHISVTVACRDYSLQWSLALHVTIHKHHNSRALYQFSHHSILGMHIATH